MERISFKTLATTSDEKLRVILGKSFAGIETDNEPATCKPSMGPRRFLYWTMRSIAINIVSA